MSVSAERKAGRPASTTMGCLFVLSGPSGVGKGTLLRHLFTQVDGLACSISATTRAPRPGEQNGREYHFMAREKFERGIAAGMFLEYAEYSGNLYGTPRDKIQAQLDAGISVFLEIEVKGAMQVQALCPDAVLIYILPPSPQELERRLRDRKTETEAKIQQRLAIAEEERTYLAAYNYVVVNDDLERATEELAAIVMKERERPHRPQVCPPQDSAA